MKIRLGYNITMTHPQYTPMLLMLNIHYSRASDLLVPDHLITNPSVNVTQYRDVFGNWCSRLIAPPGPITFSTDALISDPGTLDRYEPDAIQHLVSDLPDECMQFLLGSRYCETDKLMDIAWGNFNSAPSAGAACRPSAISSIIRSPSAINTPAAPAPPMKPIRNASASAATSRIWPSPFAAA